MRIPIREQLGALVLTSALVGLAVVAIATWITNHNFVLGIRASRLSLTASLKAAQMNSNLMLMQSSVRNAATRVLIQSAMLRYNSGNNTAANWVRAADDLAAGLSSGQQSTLLLQGQVYPPNDTGLAGPGPVMNSTIDSITGQIQLPYNRPDGSPVFLGDANGGFPPNLYPNLTYSTRRINDTAFTRLAGYNGRVLDQSSTLLLGPWQLNETFSLLSITMPIINNTSNTDIIGWITVVADGRLITDVLTSPEGLDSTGIVLLVGPTSPDNHFPSGILYNENRGTSTTTLSREPVHFVIAPGANASARHGDRVYGGIGQLSSFTMGSFPPVQTGVTRNQNSINNAGSLISTHNEIGKDVSIGFAMPQTPIVDWIILLEQTHQEVWAPINRLRNVLIACVFGTAGALLLLAFPVAHYSSRPIRRLKEATLKTVQPPGYSDDGRSVSSFDSRDDTRVGGDDDPEGDRAAEARKEGFMGALSRWRHGDKLTRAERKEAQRRRQFRIPGKVKERRHFIQDELTDLTHTFNEMSDELMMQYTKLEERVQQRTAELELSKKAAEAANESKTLFIANISHELKTPLNGILGMCAVCMQEDDPIKIKRSLGIIYKSGDLLHNLLTDLLTFSKNQVGQHITLDEKEFRLRDISSQVQAIFDKQAKEGEIDLRIRFQGPFDPSANEGVSKGDDRTDFAPFGLGRVKDMILWGDQHRILQVVINLVSNSLKFTAKGGSVMLTIRCTGEAEDRFGSRKGSLQSRQSKQGSGRNSRNRNRLGGGSDASIITPSHTDTANEINALGKTIPYSQIIANERANSPPPGRMLQFEFEVEDTGPGIPEHLQQRIFEPFVQGDLGLSKKYGGTGLGLSICSQLSRLMKGDIGLKSEVGVGSVFTMRIPLRHLFNRADSTASSSVNLAGDSRRNSSIEEARTPRFAGDDTKSVHSATSNPAAPVTFEADSKPRLVGMTQPFFASNAPLESPNSQLAAVERVTAEATQRGDKVKVLVAEDNKVNQEVVLRMLKLEDIYDVTVAKDGQEALDKVKESMENQRPYNLIFMDVQMPNLDGLQSTRQIRAIGYQAPIVALTAFAEESNVQDCYDSGMNYFLSKPIRRPALKQVLKTYCAPIPEVEEESTTPQKEKDQSSAQPSAPLPNGVPLANGVPPSTSDPAPASQESTARPTFIVGSGGADGGPRSPGSPAISPMTH